MNWSKALIHTVKETPKDAETASHQLLIKAGYIRMTASGIYTYMPLAYRMIEKIKKIIEEEMDSIGGQEMLMPVLTPREIWDETGRWSDFGDNMFRVKDRKGREFAMSPTHEEIITDIARKEIKSYKELPQIWYQIQTKFRDEPRPKAGLMRVRQFEMKDSYSLDRDYESLEKAYMLHREAYSRIFSRCGIKFSVVQASSGLMGGRKSEEFMAVADAGESSIVLCSKCGKAWNSEVARPMYTANNSPEEELKEIETPVEGDISTVSDYLKADKSKLIKSILFIRESSPVFALIPGDREIDEEKLTLIWGEKFRYADEEEIKQYTNSPKGYISPIGNSIEVFADLSLKGANGMISGANREHYHYSGISLDRDISRAEFADIISIRAGDKCSQCGGEIRIEKAIEIGHIFQLGTKYSQSMKAQFVDENGELKPIVMGSYGIGLGRIASTVLEQNNDANGMKLPITIAPYEVLIIPLNSSEESVVNCAESLYNSLKDSYGVLRDDRELSPGIKFKDADLIGIPVRIVIGRKFIETGEVEVSLRRNSEKHFIKLETAVEFIEKLIEEEESIYNG